MIGFGERLYLKLAVELARARGVAATVGDVQELSFEDESFDCVIAAWMLYHVPDLDRGLREIARVLRPAGSLIAVTNSRRHLHGLWKLVGQDGYELPFNAENAQEILERHFRAVEQRDIEGTVTLPTGTQRAGMWRRRYAPRTSLTESPISRRRCGRLDATAS